MASLLRWRARRQPGFPATWYEGRERSYAELDQRTTELAAALLTKLHVEPGDRVGILEKNSDEYIELLLALDKLGAVACPINWRLTASEIASIVADASPKLMVVGEDFRESTRDLSCPSLDFRELPREVNGLDPCRDQEDLVTWQLYTSGTSGVPKGAMISGLNLFGLIGNLFQEIKGFEEGGRTLVAMPLYHVGGCGWVRFALYSGCTAVVTREFVARDILRTIAEQQINTMFLVPAALRLLISEPELSRADCSSVKNIVYGGSPIALELFQRSAEAFGCRLTQVYGLTETAGSVAFLQHEEHRDERFLSCGRAGFGHELRVVGHDAGELPPGETGEIVYRGPSMMAGYWHRQDDLEKAIRGGWLHTGDAGAIDERGFIYIKDRIKDMIISGGENIYPAEIERVLAEHPEVADVAVIAVPDDKWGEAVKAVVIRTPGGTISADELVAWSRSRLAGFKRPRSVDFVDSLPRNASGKVLKKDLREPYWTHDARRVH